MKRVVIFLFISLLGGCGTTPFWHAEKQWGTSRQWQEKPSDYNLKYNDVILSTEDGLRLHGWWLHANGEPQATVYYLHDFSGNIGDHLEKVSTLAERGVAVFMLDYRGFGLSEGKLGQPYLAADAALGLDWLRTVRKATDVMIVLAQSDSSQLLKAELGKEAHRGRFDCLVEAKVDESVWKLLEQRCSLQKGVGDVREHSPSRRVDPASPVLPSRPVFSF